MQCSISLLVYSELDGIWLDHETYRSEAARPALERLADLGVPVVLASSKTADELIILQKQMGLSGYPATVEKGAGLTDIGAAAPDNLEYRQLRQVLDTLPEKLRAGFAGFDVMSVERVAEATGLPAGDAARARARAFFEPGSWTGPLRAREEFLAALAQRVFRHRQGRAFLPCRLKGRRKTEWPKWNGSLG